MLDSLIAPSGNNSTGENVSRETSGGLIWLPIDQIQPNPYQTRLGDDPDHVLALAQSIWDQRESLPATHGLQQIPLARLAWTSTGGPLSADQYRLTDKFILEQIRAGEIAPQLAFGHTRLAAFRLLAQGPSPDFLPTLVGIEQDWPEASSQYASLPVRLVHLDDEQMWQQAEQENRARKNITAIEEATSLQRAIDAFGWTQAQAAQRAGISRSAATNKLRLLRLPDDVRQAIQTGQLSEMHGRLLLRLEDDPERIADLAAHSVADNWTTRRLEDEVNRWRRMLDEAAEKNRQFAALQAAGITVPVMTSSEEARRTTSLFQNKSFCANSALIENGQCGPQCECYRLCWLTTWQAEEERYTKAAPDVADRVGVCCINDRAAMQKSRALHMAETTKAAQAQGGQNGQPQPRPLTVTEAEAAIARYLARQGSDPAAQAENLRTLHVGLVQTIVREDRLLDEPTFNVAKRAIARQLAAQIPAPTSHEPASSSPVSQESNLLTDELDIRSRMRLLWQKRGLEPFEWLNGKTTDEQLADLDHSWLVPIDPKALPTAIENERHAQLQIAFEQTGELRHLARALGVLIRTEQALNAAQRAGLLDEWLELGNNALHILKRLRPEGTGER